MGGSEGAYANGVWVPSNSGTQAVLEATSYTSGGVGYLGRINPGPVGAASIERNLAVANLGVVFTFYDPELNSILGMEFV